MESGQLFLNHFIIHLYDLTSVFWHCRSWMLRSWLWLVAIRVFERSGKKHTTTDWHPTWSHCIWKPLELAHLTCPDAVTEDIWFLTREDKSFVIDHLTALANTWLSVWHPVCIMSWPTQLVMSFISLRCWLSPVQSMALESLLPTSHWQIRSEFQQTPTINHKSPLWIDSKLCASLQIVINQVGKELNWVASLGPQGLWAQICETEQYDLANECPVNLHASPMKICHWQNVLSMCQQSRLHRWVTGTDCWIHSHAVGRNHVKGTDGTYNWQMVDN